MWFSRGCFGFSAVLFFLSVNFVFAQPIEKKPGYKGVPWGSSFDVFKSLSKYGGDKDDQIDRLEAHGETLPQISLTGYLLLAGSKWFKKGDYAPALPSKFMMIPSDEGSDSLTAGGVAFYDDKLLFGYSGADSDDDVLYKNLKKELPKKYKLVDTATVVDKEELETRAITYWAYAKDEDTLIYLIYYSDRDLSKVETVDWHGIIEISKSMLKTVRDDVQSLNSATDKAANDKAKELINQ